MTIVEMLSAADAARITGLSPYTIRAAVRDGELPASKLRGRIRIHPDHLAGWIDNSRITPTPTLDGPRASIPTPRPRPTVPAGSARQAVRDRKRAA